MPLANLTMEQKVHKKFLAENHLIPEPPEKVGNDEMMIQRVTFESGSDIKICYLPIIDLPSSDN